jgi:molecular chaperone DnaJ
LQVHVLPDARFERAGNDLLATIEVPMVAAALGTAYRLDTLDGLRVIRVEPGTQPGFVAKLKGLGVGKLHGSGRGDLLVTINVVVPSDLTPRQVELLQHFSADRGEEQPPLPEPEVRPGLFGPRTSRSKKRKK